MRIKRACPQVAATGAFDDRDPVLPRCRACGWRIVHSVNSPSTRRRHCRACLAQRRTDRARARMSAARQAHVKGAGT